MSCDIWTQLCALIPQASIPAQEHEQAQVQAQAQKQEQPEPAIFFKPSDLIAPSSPSAPCVTLSVFDVDCESSSAAAAAAADDVADAALNAFLDDLFEQPTVDFFDPQLTHAPLSISDPWRWPEFMNQPDPLEPLRCALDIPLRELLMHQMPADWQFVPQDLISWCNTLARETKFDDDFSFKTMRQMALFIVQSLHDLYMHCCTERVNVWYLMQHGTIVHVLQNCIRIDVLFFCLCVKLLVDRDGFCLLPRPNKVVDLMRMIQYLFGKIWAPSIKNCKARVQNIMLQL
jgi:hypothetical protein